MTTTSHQSKLDSVDSVAELERVSRLTTRYVGSKRRFMETLAFALNGLVTQKTTVLDPFGGSGIVSYLFKSLGAQVMYNDYLAFNYWIGKALIENDSVILSESDIKDIISENNSIEYPEFIRQTFDDYYYTREENAWLDIVSTNIRNLSNSFKKAVAYYALLQACLIKRPWNVFNRRNLYFRESNQPRNFGNKRTWDTPFEVMFRRFAQEINSCIFSNGHKNRALNLCIDKIDINELPCNPDVVYLDPPSARSHGRIMDYHDLYHFLEGLVNYDQWGSMIDFESPNLRMKPIENLWSDPYKLGKAWRRCIFRFRDSTLVISYRSPSYPALRWIKGELTRIGKKWEAFSESSSSLVLTPRNQRPEMEEIVIIAR